MRCPDCWAWTSVLETRTRSTGVVRRRYVCANEHRFSTIETLKTLKNERHSTTPRRLPRSAAKTASQLAKELGVTEARVRQIRKELL